MVICQARPYPYTKPSVAIMTTDGFVCRVLLLVGKLAGWFPCLYSKTDSSTGGKTN